MDEEQQRAVAARRIHAAQEREPFQHFRLALFNQFPQPLVDRIEIAGRELPVAQFQKPLPLLFAYALFDLFQAFLGGQGKQFGALGGRQQLQPPIIILQHRHQTLVIGVRGDGGVQLPQSLLFFDRQGVKAGLAIEQLSFLLQRHFGNALAPGGERIVGAVTGRNQQGDEEAGGDAEQIGSDTSPSRHRLPPPLRLRQPR